MSRVNTLVWVAVTAVAVVGLIFAIKLFPGRTSQVILVFPEGFRGTAKIRAHRPTGAPIRRVDGTLLLAFPTSGVLDISGDLPTLKWHVLKAKFERGAPIPVVSQVQSAPDDSTGLRSLGVTEGGAEDWYAVGTAQDAKRGLTEKWGFWPKLNTETK